MAYPYKIYTYKGDGTGGTSGFYKQSNGKFTLNEYIFGTDYITSIALPSKLGYRCNGYYRNSDFSGEKCVNSLGEIKAALFQNLTGDTTIYAKYTETLVTITVNHHGGTGGTNTFYWWEGNFYADAECTTRITSITLSRRSGYKSKGCYSVDSSSGAKYVNGGGGFTEAFLELDVDTAATGRALTIHERWKADGAESEVKTIKVEAHGGTGGTDTFYYRDGFCSNEDGTDQISAITPPTRDGSTLLGFYATAETASGETQLIDASGNISEYFRSNPPTANMTIHARWTADYWLVTLDKSGGTGGTDYIYRKKTGGFYADAALTQSVSSVTPPTRSGYNFNSYRAEPDGVGTAKYTDASGDFTDALTSFEFSADLTIYAFWKGKSYTVTFDYNGGSGATVSKSVTSGEYVGELPSPTKAGYDFDGWEIDGQPLTAVTLYDFAADKTAVAQWRLVGDVVDYFRLANAALIPIESDSGDDKPHVVTRHYGRKGATAASTLQWMNPTVKYMVVHDMTGSGKLSLSLGKAFAARTGKTGYMITSVTVETALKAFPVVTVSATANEGVNAINLFAVEVSILARARPQVLVGTITGGGNLQACSLHASCTPVVLAESRAASAGVPEKIMVPCASDVTGGNIELHAETLAPSGEAAPSVAGFDSSFVSEKAAANNYIRRIVTARKEIA